MSSNRPAALARIGLLSTYPPTKCGLATFTAALAKALNRDGERAAVVRVLETAPSRESEHPVVGQLVADDADSAAAAIDRLNAFDVVVLQHEYGIFGGPDGRDVLSVAAGLTVPLVVVFHTVLTEPTLRQRRILQRLLELASVGVTMTETARERLVTHYGADPALVTVIPHGALDNGPVREWRATAGRPVVLTWGLLGPGKGIEWALAAMPSLRDLDPVYRVIGRTHPKVRAYAGETYRQELLEQVGERGLRDVVELDDSYLSVTDLVRLVEEADVVLLPYDSREQVTSGVLIEAVAAGRPVVSTSFPHAVELLGDGTGLIVPPRDPAAIAAALRRVLTEPGLAQDMAARATRKAPDLLWPSVAARYQGLADDLVAAALAAAS